MESYSTFVEIWIKYYKNKNIIINIYSCIA